MEQAVAVRSSMQRFTSFAPNSCSNCCCMCAARCTTVHTHTRFLLMSQLAVKCLTCCSSSMDIEQSERYTTTFVERQSCTDCFQLLSVCGGLLPDCQPASRKTALTVWAPYCLELFLGQWNDISSVKNNGIVKYD